VTHPLFILGGACFGTRPTPVCTCVPTCWQARRSVLFAEIRPAERVLEAREIDGVERA